MAVQTKRGSGMDIQRMLRVEAAAKRQAAAVSDVFNYWAAEFRKLEHWSAQGVKVKFSTEGADTRWLSLTPEQFEAVKRAMLDIQED